MNILILRQLPVNPVGLLMPSSLGVFPLFVVSIVLIWSEVNVQVVLGLRGFRESFRKDAASSELESGSGLSRSSVCLSSNESVV